jgi:hypothetical protein
MRLGGSSHALPLGQKWRKSLFFKVFFVGSCHALITQYVHNLIHIYSRAGVPMRSAASSLQLKKSALLVRAYLWDVRRRRQQHQP